jgi:hypothetical protein
MPHTYISRLLVNLKDTAATFTKFLFVQSGLIDNNSNDNDVPLLVLQQ